MNLQRKFSKSFEMAHWGRKLAPFSNIHVYGHCLFTLIIRAGWKLLFAMANCARYLHHHKNRSKGVTTGGDAGGSHILFALNLKTQTLFR